MHVRSGKHPGAWDTIKRSLLRQLRDRTGADFTLHRTNGRWASGPRGVVAIVSAEERPEGDRWFMGLDEKALEERNPLGVILVCQTRDGYQIILGLGAAQWADLARRMSRDTARGELKFDLRRRGDRYILAGVDVTSALDDFSWLGIPAPVPGDERPESRTRADTSPAPETVERRFFARVSDGALEPLDPTGLSDGDVVLVITRPASAVPSNATLRRIIAAGGPPSLPADFADQHDAYAHGASTR